MFFTASFSLMRLADTCAKFEFALPVTATLQYLCLKIHPSHNLFLLHFFFPHCKFLTCCSWGFCLLQSQTHKPALNFAASHIVLILDMILSPLGWFQSLQDNQHSSENNFLQKEKRKPVSACTHASDYFVSHSPLFSRQSCLMDCPRARDLTASKLLVVLPKVG